VHVLSLSTAWDYGKSGICHFSLGETPTHFCKRLNL
jgi:hypothetical protein